MAGENVDDRSQLLTAGELRELADVLEALDGHQENSGQTFAGVVTLLDDDADAGISLPVVWHVGTGSHRIHIRPPASKP